MRSVSLLALVACSLSLAACAGGGGGGTFSAASLAQTSEVCTIEATGAGCTPTVDPPVDPDPEPDPDTDPDNPTGTGNDNQGNSTRLTSGDRTIIIETSKVKNKKDTPGLAVLTENADGTAQIAIDTTLSDEANAKWPKPKKLAEYTYGSNNPGIDSDIANFTPAHLGANSYKEYRALSYNDAGTSQDEVLQVWNFNNSHATQYRNLTDGGEAGMQAWSFGGNKTAAADMPTGGTANYNGRWGATAKTWNWAADNSIRTIDVNNLWRITGSATATADFGAGTFTSTLTPEVWNAYATLNGASGFTSVDATDPTDPNWYGYMNDAVVLNGTITNNATTGNEITGSANMDQAQGWVTNQSVNPFYGAFFGAGASEVTGVFALESVAPSPTGGNIPINDDRRGFLFMTGVVNVQ